MVILRWHGGGASPVNLVSSGHPALGEGAGRGGLLGALRRWKFTVGGIYVLEELLHEGVYGVTGNI